MEGQYWLEVPHADLSEVTGMVFVEVDSVMVLATGVTATSGMLSVFADAAVTVGDVAAKLSGLLLVGTHFCGNKNKVKVRTSFDII